MRFGTAHPIPRATAVATIALIREAFVANKLTERN
jgi:hypothetical protein